MLIKEIVKTAEVIDGWMSKEELEWLAFQASTRKAILEIGSWKGRSTKALAMATCGTVFAIDHWLGSEGERQGSHREAVEVGQAGMIEVFKSNLKWELEFGKAVQVVGNSADLAPTVRKLLDARRAEVDMLFIDAAHTYASVRQDIETWVPLVRPGGLICGHDYSSGCRDVVAAVHDTLGRPDAVVGSIWFKQAAN